ncbi:MAG: M15 family metallopeptidase [Bacteroidetes bacterium]|nr:M15 family metallopeptidase [Bacteroidota bacterium]MCL2303265.1 M15 family metallopeptidase [Lentimicrobiaceae bacterium]
MKRVSFFIVFLIVFVSAMSQNKDVAPADTSKGVLVLVNKTFYLTKDFIPDSLVKMEEKHGNSAKMIKKETYQAFITMYEAAKLEEITLWIVSAYRPYAYQNWLYNRSVEENGVTEANRTLAQPGFSEHQTGLAIDIVPAKGRLFKGFEKTKQFEWLLDNAHKYGFILRYPKGKEEITGYSFEPWHYRYVGIIAAKRMKRFNLTFEEYYEQLIQR